MKYNSPLVISENDSNSKIIKRIKRGSTVLEFGSANGRMTKFLKQEMDCNVYIVEIEKEAFEDALLYAEDGICDDILNYKWLTTFSHIKFDVITFADVLEHLYSSDEVLKNAKTLLKENGIILASIPNIAHNDIIINLSQNKFNYTDIGILDNTHVHFWGYENLDNFINDCGLEIVYEDAVICNVTESEQANQCDVLDSSFLEFLCKRPLGLVYQFILEMKTKEDVKNYNVKKIRQLGNLEKKLISKVYYNDGNGFSEDKIIISKMWSSNEFEYMFLFPKPIRECRFDPIEKTACVLKNVMAVTNLGIANYENKNGITIDNYELFTTTDPQLYFDFNNDFITSLKIKAEIYPIDDIESLFFVSKLFDLRNEVNRKEEFNLTLLEEKNFLTETVIKEKEEIIKDLTEKNEEIIIDLTEKNEEIIKDLTEKSEEIKRILTDEKEKLKVQKEELEKLLEEERNRVRSTEVEMLQLKEKMNELSDNLSSKENELQECITLCKNYQEQEKIADTYQSMYNEISNSASWKITKPVRKTLDEMKKVLKPNKFLNYVNKGMRCLSDNGLPYTYQKTKLVLNRGKTNANYLLAIENDNEFSSVLEESIKFSILIPVFNTPERLLIEAVESVIQQSYSNWELCISDGSNKNEDTIEHICRRFAESDSRIKYKKLNTNLGISGNTNECSNMASGEYLVLFDHDDLLMKNALRENAIAIHKTNADILYSDEDHITQNGNHINPFFKPDWSPDLLQSQMYVCHLFVFRKSLFDKVNGFDSEYDGSQDYDLLLRMSEETNAIYHIPQILYSWRETESSTATNVDAKPYAHGAGLKALSRYLKSKYGENAYAEDTNYTFVYEARYNLLTDNPKVSIIIPMKDKWELTDKCVSSISNNSSYTNYEILILDNNSIEEKTFCWFERVRKNPNVRVIKADMEFNWSRLNNFGISQAVGEVYIFLNNDTIVISEDWIEKLAENALRDEVGIVGPQLLYKDSTIQHAGIVVGIGGWADHIFKGMHPVHNGSPFVSPMVTRNVLAVTGACMVISKKKLEKIGLFDEEYIICGSDVEMCIRAHEAGLYNIYKAQVQLYHLESKSRDSYIPEIDFKKSYECYSFYRENGDPYFNANLDINSVIPKERDDRNMNLRNIKNYIKRNKITAPTYEKLKEKIIEVKQDAFQYDIPEIYPIEVRRHEQMGEQRRINLLVPSIDKKHVFGGIATALQFYEKLQDAMNISGRIIVTDSIINKDSSVKVMGELIDSNIDSLEPLQIVSFGDRYKKTIPVGKNDIFIATGWWTAYMTESILEWQKQEYNISPQPLLYLIQDFEPGFYPWSSKYLLADSTYKMNVPIIAIFNSKYLNDYFINNKYKFKKSFYFDPVLNENLKQILLSKVDNLPKRKKQILLYGRPNTERNAFELILLALEYWAERNQEAKEWTVVSAGEPFSDIKLGNELSIHSVGKLTLEEYGQLMLESYLGISLMVSPHPSYPPLEMSTFGVKTITNSYANKELAHENENIISLDNCSAKNLALEIEKQCSLYGQKSLVCIDTSYVTELNKFEAVINDIAEILH